jgi:hypothetical protein
MWKRYHIAFMVHHVTRDGINTINSDLWRATER